MGAMELTLEDVEKLVTGATPEEEQAKFNALPQETRDAIKQLRKDYITILRDDTPESCASFLKNMEGVSLEDFALEAVRDAYKAHE